MVWLLRRTLVLWVGLTVICSAIMLIARLNRAPTRLQALGFGVCDGSLRWGKRYRGGIAI
jgi:hypothetical protein